MDKDKNSVIKDRYVRVTDDVVTKAGKGMLK